MATIDIVRDVLVENQDLDPEAITEDAVIEDRASTPSTWSSFICDIEDSARSTSASRPDLVTIGDIVEHIDSLK